MKKILSVILALAMLTGTACAAAFAEEDIEEGDYLTGDISFDTEGLLKAYASSILSAYLDTDQYKNLFSGDKALDEKAIEQLKELLTVTVLALLEDVDNNEYSDIDDVYLLSLASVIRKALSGKNADAVKEAVNALSDDADADFEKLIDETIASLQEGHPEEFADISDDEAAAIRAALILSTDALVDDDEDADDDGELDDDQIEMLDFLGLLIYAANN